jgi:hypothetical protein
MVGLFTPVIAIAFLTHYRIRHAAQSQNSHDDRHCRSRYAVSGYQPIQAQADLEAALIIQVFPAGCMIHESGTWEAA